MSYGHNLKFFMTFFHDRIYPLRPIRHLHGSYPYPHKTLHFQKQYVINDCGGREKIPSLEYFTHVWHAFYCSLWKQQASPRKLSKNI